MPEDSRPTWAASFVLVLNYIGADLLLFMGVYLERQYS